MFRRSLDRLGGIYQRADVVAVFGGSVVEELPERWQPHFERITVRHASPADFKVDSYRAQGDARWKCAPAGSDIAIMADADTMILRPIDDLLSRLIESPAIAGTIAHYPFPQFPGETPRDKWASLARDWAGRDMPLTYVHSLTRQTDPPWFRECPFYINFGFVLVPRQLLDPLGSTYRSLTEHIPPALKDPFYGAQVALTLAIYKHDLARYAFDIKYNFPNDPVAEELHASSLADIRVIHYLRTDQFDRNQIFATRQAFDSFLALPLTGSSLILQDHVRRIAGGQYPF